MAVGEFMAGSAEQPVFTLLAAHTGFLPRALARAGLLLRPVKHHLLRMKAAAPLTVKSDCSLMCEAAISDWTETTEENCLLETSAHS